MMPAPDLSWASLIDWQKAFSGDQEPEISWLAEPFLETATLNAVYGGMKTGKSLLVQDIAAALASGRSVLGNPPAAPVHVLYLDFENNLDVIVERYRAMGYGPEHLPWLHYASYPQLPNLDTPEGGEQACQLAYCTAASLVIIDTTSRVLGGAENSADTFADLYKHTLMRLKRARHTVLHIDHEGKDTDRGQRGSSAKGADVDVVWHLEPEGRTGLLRLDPELERTRHVSAFRVQRLEDPLRHQIIRTALSPVQVTIAEHLDRLEVPATASRKECREALRGGDLTARTDDLAVVVRHRKIAGTAGSGLSPGAGMGQPGQIGPDLGGQQLGQMGQQTWDKDPTHSVGLSRPGTVIGHDWEYLASIVDWKQAD